jgi:glutamate:Na+ symporter, ESS family
VSFTAGNGLEGVALHGAEGVEEMTNLEGAMKVHEFDNLQTVIIGLTCLQIANFLSKRIPGLAKANIPAPVIGGVLGALGVTLARTFWDVEVHFATKLTDFMLLVFFTSVGLTAKLSALKAGGKPLVLVCAATVILIVAQNITGIAVAMGFGANPLYGLLVGSISCVGGPGTAAAWAKEAQAMGMEHATEVAVAGATLAVVVGALVSGPLTGLLVRRKNLKAEGASVLAPWIDQSSAPGAAKEKGPAPIPVDRAMGTFLLILIAVMIGQLINGWAKSSGMVLPGFLTAMIGGVLITNGADLLGRKLDFEPIERDGELALKTFLVMFLMSLKLWTLGSAVVPLVVNVVLQVGVSAAVAYYLLFKWLGRDYDAAVTFGGFLGFGLSSMAVGMSSMDKVASRYGPSPKAFLLITLSGSFFVDLANAFIVQLMMKLPFLH